MTTPIQVDGGDAKPVDEKFVSYLRGEFRSTAEAQGRSGKVAEAMVDYEVVVEGLIGEDDLLTLDEGQALVDWLDTRPGDMTEIAERTHRIAGSAAAFGHPDTTQLHGESMPDQHIRQQFHAMPPGRRWRNMARVSCRPFGRTDTQFRHGRLWRLPSLSPYAS